MKGRFYAFEKAHKLDPKSDKRGVRQFKTYLLHRLEKPFIVPQDEEEVKPQLAKNDPREIQKFYQWYYHNFIREGPAKSKP
ncbi:hypothetical protein GW17_00034381 [Ensete ventricosum]|nr:hypothetical protein GW17_00034381 [Ensete ventricosum]